MTSRITKPRTTSRSAAPAPTTTTTRRARPPTNADELADALGSRLKIGGSSKRGPEVTTTNPKDARADSMRAVNASMQAMTAMAQSGWKKSATDSSSAWRTQNAQANKLAVSSRDHLANLRSIDGSTIEMERAALSCVGKLVALDMHEAARDHLKDMHSSFCKSMGLSSDHYLFLQLPAQPVQDTIHLTMISTYLIQALVTTGETIDDLAHHLLAPGNHTIISWLPYLSPLPAKHVDSLLTRAYSSLTKSCGSRASPTRPTSSHRSVYIIRGYALQCLVKASPGTVEPDAYWDQVVRFTASFAKSCAEAKEVETGSTLVMTTFDKIVHDAQARTDAPKFLHGTKFFTFCEYWITFAKRTGDISTLDRIGNLMGKIPSSSTKVVENVDTKNPENVLLQGTKLCGSLAQCVALMEDAPNEDELLRSLQTCTDTIRTSKCLPALLVGKDHISGKVDRAFERLRRGVHKLLEAKEQSAELKKQASKLIEACVDVLRAFLPSSSPETDAEFRTDVTTRAVDSLFLLARTAVDIANPQTYIPAYDHLEAAVAIIDILADNPDNAEIDTPNYLRCISGAFYNIAGSLYQNSRFGAAVPFLKQTCVIGGRALDEHKTQDTSKPMDAKGKGKAKDRDNEWVQLEGQLYRRWELLAVCYLKNGDRKNSYDAFMKCIYTFPFSTTNLSSSSDAQCLQSIFNVTQSADQSTITNNNTPLIKSLSSLLDRVSYVGACELLLPPDQVSLYHTLTLPSLDKSAKSPSGSRDEAQRSHLRKLDLRIVGLLLEYQYASLFVHRAKEGARGVLVQLLKDLRAVYGLRGGLRDEDEFLMPVRRARVGARCLEFLYWDEVDPPLGVREFGYEDVGDLGRDVLNLLQRPDLSHDTGLAIYRSQYMISTQLWLANLSHRQSPPSLIADVSAYVGQANQLLETLQREVGTPGSKLLSQRKASLAASPLRRGTGGKILTTSPKVAGRTTRMRGPPPAPRKPVAPRRAPATRGETKAAPVTPKAKSRAVLASMEKTPPRTSLDAKAAAGQNAMPFDDFGRFYDLLMLTTRILGLLSLILPRFQLLAFLRKLSQRQLGSSSEEFITASLELAYEYAKLGKLKRATSVFSTALDIVRSGETSPEIAAFFLLRFAETLALMNDVQRSSSVYLEAFEYSDKILGEHKGMTSVQKIQSRARRLELSAMACRVFALIQGAREDGTLALSTLLQSLRLWNRAIDTTSRLVRTSTSLKSQDSSSQNPFESSAGSESGTTTASGDHSQSQAALKSTSKSSTELQWRLLEGLIFVLFSLADAYLTRGSPREAEYFLKQVQTLAGSSGLPTIETRAVTRLVEVQLGLGKLEDAAVLLDEVAQKMGEDVALDSVDHQRLLARYSEKLREEGGEGHAVEISGRALEMLQMLNGDFQKLDGHILGSRRSLDGPDLSGEFIVPELLSTVLSRYIWLLRGNSDAEIDELLTKLCSLPPSTHIEAQRNSLMANLTLHKVHQRFQSDMFLNSLTESTIAIPMGMLSKNGGLRTLPVHDVLTALDSAEKYFQDSISLTAAAGDVVHFRDAAVSLTLVKAFQTSLGRIDESTALHTASLLDASSAITLRREMLEAIQQKLASLKNSDDFEWPMLTANGAPKAQSPNGGAKRRPMLLGDSDLESDDDEEFCQGRRVKEYWQAVQSRYQSKILDADSLRSSQTKDLPSNWTIVHVHVVEDNSTLLISRQECGDAGTVPVVFCIPLKGRRDNGTGDDEEHLSFEDALAEFAEIIRLSNESTKRAVHVRSDDDEARAAWWKERNGLDARLQELLDNIEFCWLGAFKTIMGPRSSLTSDQLDELRAQFDKVFQRHLQVKEKRTKARTGHKKATSQAQGPSQVHLDDSMLRCFSGLSPKCRDEELEDLLYFVLDLYQFHGVPVHTAEVDSMQAVVDLRGVLEEFNGRLQRSKKSRMGSGKGHAGGEGSEEHVFLVLDKNVQGLPWESLPTLRGRSVSRIPCIDFLHDRIAFAALRREQRSRQDVGDGTAVVDSRNGYFILNPSGDLTKTQGRFEEWADGMKRLGWEGVIGEAVTEHQFSEALKTRDLVVYFGHGGGEQYIRSQRIRALPTCAATMLWGCSSGTLKEMGDFDRVGTPYNYMLGGCPTLIANLWDVTDRDIDKFSLSVFDKIGLHGSVIRSGGLKGSKSMSIVTAVAQSREVCKLKYLTGAAPVVYGIPFHL